MKMKILILASLLMLCISCEQNTPSQEQEQPVVESNQGDDNASANEETFPDEDNSSSEEQGTSSSENGYETEEDDLSSQTPDHPIVGIWNAPLRDYLIKSLAFASNGMVDYRVYGEYPINPGTGYSMMYSVQEDELVFSEKAGCFAGFFQTLPYTTPYSIQDDILTIDNFQSEGGDFYTLQLKKAEKIEKVSLEKETSKVLKQIFSPSNELLEQNTYEGNVYVIGSMSELQKICPDGISVPTIDFTKQCIIFASCYLTDNKTWRAELYRNQEVDLYEFLVSATRDPQDMVYAYGVFAVPADKIEKIKQMVQLMR